jgi:hypothetical protein
LPQEHWFYETRANAWHEMEISLERERGFVRCVVGSYGFRRAMRPVEGKTVFPEIRVARSNNAIVLTHISEGFLQEVS